jgi:succinate dehydrogenase/fumarate reductase flavoprotein subunit
MGGLTTSSRTRRSFDRRKRAYDAIVSHETNRQTNLLKNEGNENPYLLWQEMGKWMTDNCTVVRLAVRDGKLERVD